LSNNFAIQFPKSSQNVVDNKHLISNKIENEEKILLKEIRNYFGFDNEIEKFYIFNKDLVELWTIGSQVTRGIEDFRKIKLWYQEMFESQTLSTTKNTIQGKLGNFRIFSNWFQIYITSKFNNNPRLKKFLFSKR
jgi:hypothetical protein